MNIQKSESWIKPHSIRYLNERISSFNLASLRLGWNRNQTLKYLLTLGMNFLIFGDYANALDCQSDCSEYASFSFPCPTFRNPRRTCEGRDPTKFTLCEEFQIACRISDEGKEAIDKIATQIQAQVYDNSVAEANKGGWDLATCTGVGAGAILLPAGAYIAPLCGSIAYFSAGGGLTLCVNGVSAAIVAGTCAQLCQEHRLSDEKCH